MKNYAGGCYHNTLRDLHTVITDVPSQKNASGVINAAPPPPPTPTNTLLSFYYTSLYQRGE